MFRRRPQEACSNRNRRSAGASDVHANMSKQGSKYERNLPSPILERESIDVSNSPYSLLLTYTFRISLAPPNPINRH